MISGKLNQGDGKTMSRRQDSTSQRANRSMLQTSKMERFFSQIGTEVTGSSLWLHSKEGSGLKTRGWLKSAEPVGRS